MYSIKENILIKQLEDLPANKIYFLSAKNFVESGYRDYRDARVLALEWNNDYSVLTAKIMGNDLFSVKITVRENSLKYYCDCPAWTPSGNCKHVICSLFTIKNILSPDRFKIPQNPEYRRKLEEFLHIKKKDDPSEETPETEQNFSKFRIVLENNSNQLCIEVEKDGEQIDSFTRQIPKPLKQLQRFSQLYEEDFQEDNILEKEFIHYLREQKNLFPLSVKIRNKIIPIKWEEGLDYEKKVELNGEDNFISIRRICWDKSGPITGRMYQLSSNLAVNLETRKLILLKDNRGWNLWNYFYEILNFEETTIEDYEENNFSYLLDDLSDPKINFIDYSLKIPVEIFQRNQIFSLPCSEESIFSNLILKIKGENFLPLRTEHKYNLTLLPNKKKNGMTTLKTECTIGSGKFPTVSKLFSYFYLLEKGESIPNILKTKRRKQVLFQIMIELLNCQDQEEVITHIKKRLTEEKDFDSYDTKFKTQKLLESFSDLLIVPEESLHFADNQWFITRRNKTGEGLLYSIPYEIFGKDIFQYADRYDELHTYTADLNEKLTHLYTKLKEKDIGILFEHKPIETAEWDFSFDASRSDIDWFEIKPDIRCNGIAINEKEWLEAIEGKGIIEKEGALTILNHHSQNMLRIISNLISPKDKSEKSKREIIKIPKLQILDWVQLRKSGVKIKLSPENEALIEKLLKFEKIDNKPIPERVQAKLRPYQKTGFNWLAFLYEHRLGACLADDMGLGKTIQAITLLCAIQEGIVKPADRNIKSPHLIILPVSLLFNWQNELEKFAPNLKMHFFTGQERKTVFNDCDIVLTTYGIIRKDIEKLKEINFHVIIFDEAQAVKNIYADTTAAARQLKGYFKLTMTGTPVENHVGEYYSILDLSIPGLLGDYDKFNAELKKEQSAMIDLIIKRTKVFVLRRTKEDVLTELPPKVETDIYLELNQQQKELYQKTVDLVKASIDHAYRDKTEGQAQIIALTALLKLRQICVSPKLIHPEFEEQSPKIEFLIGKLKELLEEGHSALVFSQFTTFLNILEKELKKNSLDFYRLDGSTTLPKRKSMVEGFQGNEQPSIFLLSLKAGGQGLNLTKASYVFHLDPWWNPAVENQASDRAHRIGQKNRVTITRILMHHTIEEKMMVLKEKKLALYETIMGETTVGKKRFSISRQDIEFLLG